jgi:hypothetical protein
MSSNKNLKISRIASIASTKTHIKVTRTLKDLKSGLLSLTKEPMRDSCKKIPERGTSIQDLELLWLTMSQCLSGELRQKFMKLLRISTVICSSYDFYMISQEVSSGTASPTYYNILCDEFYMNNPKVMHAITYKLCHSYYNWSGTTRIPSVVQYAKKLALLTSQYLQYTPSLEMPVEKQLFFL